MRNNDQRDVMFAHIAFQRVKDSHGIPGIEVGRGLVSEKQLGTGDDCATDGNPLSFSLGEFTWSSMEHPGYAHLDRDFPGPVSRGVVQS
jgi:hypothetical protein